MAYNRGNQLLEGDFNVILDLNTILLFWLIYFKLQRNGTENGLSNIKDPSTERFQLQMAVLHQSMCIAKAAHFNSRHVWVEYENKNLDVSDFYQNIGVWCNSKLKLPKSKDSCIKSTEKVLQDEECMQATQQL